MSTPLIQRIIKRKKKKLILKMAIQLHVLIFLFVFDDNMIKWKLILISKRIKWNSNDKIKWWFHFNHFISTLLMRVFIKQKHLHIKSFDFLKRKLIFAIWYQLKHWIKFNSNTKLSIKTFNQIILWIHFNPMNPMQIPIQKEKENFSIQWNCHCIDAFNLHKTCY